MWEEQRPWNVYHYSANNPIVAKDPDGKLANFFIGAGIGAVIEIGSQLIERGRVHSWSKVGVSIVAGAATGGLSSLAGKVVGGAAISVAEGYIHAKLEGEKYTTSDALVDASKAVVGGVASHFAEGFVKSTKVVKAAEGHMKNMKAMAKKYGKGKGRSAKKEATNYRKATKRAKAAYEQAVQIGSTVSEFAIEVGVTVGSNVIKDKINSSPTPSSQEKK